VFVFRYESENALGGPERPVSPPSAGKVPVVYCLDLSKPSGFFVARTFAVSDGDIIYAANAPAAELQKFINIVTSVVVPASAIAVKVDNTQTVPPPPAPVRTSIATGDFQYGAPIGPSAGAGDYRSGTPLGHSIDDSDFRSETPFRPTIDAGH